LPGGTEENHKNLSHDSWSPNCDSKLGTSKKEVGVLTTGPQSSVNWNVIFWVMKLLSFLDGYQHFRGTYH
jgi:hypothetical protein